MAQACRVQMPIIDLSATTSAAPVAAGQSIRYRTPRAVEKFIETHRLVAAAWAWMHEVQSASG